VRNKNIQSKPKELRIADCRLPFGRLSRFDRLKAKALSLSKGGLELVETADWNRADGIVKGAWGMRDLGFGDFCWRWG
jgi:hypothetical protein